MNIQSFDQMLKSAGMGMNVDTYVEEFAKALNTQTGTALANGNGPLMLENLDALMTSTLITQDHIKLFNKLPRIPSATPLYEYNVHTSFGSSRRGGAGFREGGAPNGGVSSFKRETIRNKYLGVAGGITLQMQTVGSNGGAFEDPSVRENQDRSIELLDKVERELLFGNKLILDENGVEANFDGLLAQLMANFGENVIDMEGEALSFDHLDDAAEKFLKVGKQATVNGYEALGSIHVMGGLNKKFNTRNLQRFNKDLATGQAYTPGSIVSKYDTNYGTIGFDHTIMSQEVDTNMPVEAAVSGAPAAPVLADQGGAATAVAADDAAGKFVAGSYYYTVAAFNDTGESLGTTSTVAVVADATTKVSVVITRVTGATGYRVYRGFADDGSDAQWIAKVPQSASGNITFVDRNGWRTQTAAGKEENGVCILMKPDPKDLAIAQMSPLMKLPLPLVGTTLPFLLMLYMVPVVKAPTRLKIFKNCGTYTPA
jgi:hypothetical protein